MAEHGEIGRLNAIITELRQDLEVNRAELTTKTKRIAQMQETISSQRLEITRKNNEIDDLRESSKVAQDHKSEQMHLRIEELQNQLRSKESEAQQIKNENATLRQKYRTLQSQFESLSFQHKQSETQNHMRLSRLESQYKQRLDQLQRINQKQLKQSQDKMEAIKQNQLLSSTQETEDIQHALNELKESHEHIESDLNAQIEDLKEQMEKREREWGELKQLSDNYRQFADEKIQELEDKLLSYQQGNVEVVLRIEVEDPIVSKPPPKGPAPRISRHSSATSSHHQSNGSHASSDSLHVLSPQSSGGMKIMKPTLENIRSNPEFWRADHSSPSGPHHRPFRSLEPRSMPGIHEMDNENETEIGDIDDRKDEEEEEEEDEDVDVEAQAGSDSENMEILDEDSKEILDEDGDDSNTLYPKIVRTNTTPTTSDQPQLSGDSGSMSNGYVSRRKKNRSFGNGRRFSHSQSKSLNLELPPPSPGSSVSGSSMFYLLRSSPSDVDKENVSQSMNDKGYNASASMFAARYKRNNHKYTDSVIGSLKNGVVSMFGTSKPSAGGGGGGGPHSLMFHYGGRATSVGYPTKAASAYANRRAKTFRRTHSTANSVYSDLHSDFGSDIDIRSYISGGSGAGSLPPIARQPTTEQTSSEALSGKGLELQRKMLERMNTRLNEDLKNEKKNVMIIKAKAHRKVKQMQIQMQAEKRQYELKEKHVAAKLERHEQNEKEDKFLINELQKKLSALEADYNLRINQNGYGVMGGNGSPIAMETQRLLNRIRQLEANNKSLVSHQEKSRRELVSLKGTIASCNETMRQQQNQILILNKEIGDMRKLHGFGRGKSSAQELLQKQVRVLKTQRGMLIQELKDLREQNEQLKNYIVTGGNPSGKK